MSKKKKNDYGDWGLGIGDWGLVLKLMLIFKINISKLMYHYSIQ